MLLPLPTPSLPPPPPHPQISGPEAPDGRAGLGADRSAQEILAVFRSPDADERELVLALERLPGDVRLILFEAHALYGARDYYDLLPPSIEHGPAELFARFQVLVESPDLGHLDARERAAFADMFLDVRFAVRASLVSSAARELGELADGCAVLRAATDGYVDLQGPQARAVARRVDLAAACLRALRSDLELLREHPASPASPSSNGASSPMEPDVLWARLRSATALDDPRTIRAERVERMRVLLATSRPGERLRTELAWRDGADERAGELLSRAAAAFPVAGEPEPEGELRGMTTTRRRRLAFESALRGLEEDPLDPELAWLAAQSAEIVRGTLEALGHYDRFLALSRIRAHDERTWRGRKLSAREEEALFYVQQNAAGVLGELLDPPEPPDEPGSGE